MLAPVTALRGVGPSLAQRLQKLGLERVQDLLFLLPLRYEDRTRITPLGELRAGDRALIQAEVQLCEVAYRRRRSLLCSLHDGTGWLTLRMFYFSRSQQAALKPGALIRAFGEVRRGPAALEMIHPEYQLLQAEDSAPPQDTLTPVYPATEGLQQGRLRALVAQALAKLEAGGLADLLPAQKLAGQSQPTLVQALRYLHKPPPDARLDQLAAGAPPCQQRLAFEELVAHQLSLRKLRERVRRGKAPVIRPDPALSAAYLSSLPFTLTRAQDRVIGEILADLARGEPMMRLVQGDVGCGKTVVATAAALAALGSDYQAALMAPTELLAEQHLATLQGWLQPLGLEVGWLSGRSRGKERTQTLARLASGDCKLVVGTHALFQDDVSFARLGLAIIDEQHRFGVHQRLALKQKGERNDFQPHQLIMSATPIPRTLAMTAYADLDCSYIDERPPGRKPVTTVAIPESRREDIVARVQRACSEGRQAYWVCPLIDVSENLEAQAAEETAALLAEALQGLKVGLVHGRMKPSEKEKVMSEFSRGQVDLLVATTVIEVGVDVANASLMIVENAERMGLAQLHQLRGRVGRGSEQSACVLMYKSPLGDTARARLEVLRGTDDGFVVAQRDLELRGPGEVLGTRQTGLMQLRVADLLRDAGLLPQVQAVAEKLYQEHGQDADALIRRWIGQADQYGEV
ncbi:MAG: ATP-dependent DNA helicase RecG [Gammaproteobacteria bacterium]|nr:ATP-dependent DNA helicase RecG [Gammaproteobacteria bacterium]